MTPRHRRLLAGLFTGCGYCLFAAALPAGEVPSGDAAPAPRAPWPYPTGAEEFPGDPGLAARWDALVDARERRRRFTAASPEKRARRDWREGLPPIADHHGGIGVAEDADDATRREAALRMMEMDLRDDVAIAERRLAAALFDRRVSEAARRPPADWPPLDQTRTPARPAPPPLAAPAPLPSAAALGLDPFAFPRLDGSTSLLNLARLTLCRAWGLPYQWEGRPVNLYTRFRYGSVMASYTPPRRLLEIGSVAESMYYGRDPEQYWINLRLAALADGPFMRGAGLVNTLMTSFHGTHRAYLRFADPGVYHADDAYYPDDRPADALPTRTLRNEPVDLLLVARRPSASETAALAQRGVELDVRPLGYDAFIFLVHRRNPVRGMAAKSLVDLYARRGARRMPATAVKGEIKRETGEDGLWSIAASYGGAFTQAIRDAEENGTPDAAIPTFWWSDHGGPPRLLTAYDREIDSGSRELMDDVVMRGRRPGADDEAGRREAEWPMAMTAPGMMGPTLALADNPWGLSYSLWNYERYMRSGADVRTLAVDGVVPSYETVADGTYPYVYDIVVVTRQGLPADAPAARLRDWLLGPDGQRVVKEAGYVPLAERRPRPQP